VTSVRASDTSRGSLIAARDTAFAVLYRAVEAGLAEGTPGDVLGTTIAAWSSAHGFAVLALNGNLPFELTADPDKVATLLAGGLVALGDITRRQAAALPVSRTGD
jgi:hypothetical protein